MTELLNERKRLLINTVKSHISSARHESNLAKALGYVHSVDIYFESLVSLQDQIKDRKSQQESKERLSKNHPPEVEFANAVGRGKAILESLGISQIQAIKDSNGDNKDLVATERKIITKHVASPEFFKVLKRTFGDDTADCIKQLSGYTLEEVRRSGCVSQQAYTDLRSAVRESFSGEGKKVVDYAKQLILSSTITDKEAMDAVEAILFDKSAINSLKDSAYNGGKAGVERLKKDTADLYRLTGGAIGINRFVKVPRRNRASFFNDYDGEMVINVGKRLDKPTLWHELSHSIEYNHPEILQATRGFLMDRLAKAEAAGSGVKPLGQIYKNNNYRSDEIAIEDSAYSHYVTKIYKERKHHQVSVDNIRSTEVITMAMQSLVDVENATEILAKDPDHLAFVLGLLDKMREEND